MSCFHSARATSLTIRWWFSATVARFPLLDKGPTGSIMPSHRSSLRPANRSHRSGRRPCLTGTLATLLVGGLLGAAPLPAAAQSINEALAAAYENNPVLQAERARLRSTDEQVSQALSGFRPTVTLNGDYGRARENDQQSTNNTSRSSSFYRNPTSLTLTVRQPLYRGGRTEAAVSRAEHNVERGRANLISVEQGVLLDAATAYMNLLRDQATLELQNNNVQVLTRQLDAARDRFQVGEITRTDVAQAESRLARGVSDRSAAEGQVAVSRAAYFRAIGEMPGKLNRPPLPPNLPLSEEEAQLRSTENPSVIFSRFTESSSRDDVNLILGEMYPTINAVGQLSRQDESSSRGLLREIAQASIEFQVPIYQQGLVEARVREAKQVAGQRRIEIETELRRAREAATSSWNNLQSAQARIVAIEAQIRGAEIALDGVEQEAKVGARTILDILDAEQELLNARVGLVVAQRDEVVASYQLGVSVGVLTAGRLGLPVVLYDPTDNYQATRNRWFGTAVPGEASEFDPATRSAK